VRYWDAGEWSRIADHHVEPRDDQFGSARHDHGHDDGLDDGLDGGLDGGLDRRVDAGWTDECLVPGGLVGGAGRVERLIGLDCPARGVAVR